MNDEEVIQKEATLEKMSLRDFIEDYQKTLASVGVLIVLGLFWKNIYGTNETPYVSYLCFLGTLPLLYEIVRAFDFYRFAWNLYFFMVILIGIFIFSAAYILANFMEHTVTILTGSLWTALMMGIHKVIGLWTTRLKTSKYEKAKEFADEVHARTDLTQEKRNQIITLKNQILQHSYKRVNQLTLLLLLIAFLGVTVFMVQLDQFLHAALKQSAPIPEIPAPKLGN